MQIETTVAFASRHNGMRLLLRPYFDGTDPVRLITIQDYFEALSWAPMQ
jgi:hypothetical protein